ncbi:MAG: hypothetical protein U0L92_06385, partial [Clostridia bacterium]|nr:hypothetical protein [Clostridia bacterium]
MASNREYIYATRSCQNTDNIVAQLLPNFNGKDENSPSFWMGNFSVSINLSARWQMLKKEGIFCEIVFVAVRWYCRERFRKKQA